MRVAMFVPSLDRKGPVIVADTLVRHLRDKVELDVLYFNEPSTVDFAVPARKLGLFDEFDFDAYDIVHSHMLEPDFFVWKGGRRRRCKTVSTLHQFSKSSLSYDFNPFVSALVTPFWNKILKTVDGLVCISDNLERYAASTIGNRRSCRIYNGIEPVRMETAINREDEARISAAKGDRRLVGAFANLTRRKGLDQLVELMAIRPDLSLLVVGDGKERPTLEALAASRGVADRCLFLGFREDIQGYFRYLDLFAMPSRSEAFGLGLVEAVSAGVPVVCSDIGTFRELFDEREIGFFELEDIRSLDAAVTRALDSGAEKVGKARRRFETFYTADRMAEGYLSLYRGLTEPRAT